MKPKKPASKPTTTVTSKPTAAMAVKASVAKPEAVKAAPAKPTVVKPVATKAAAAKPVATKAAPAPAAPTPAAVKTAPVEPTQAAIASRAYQIWEQEGCPAGRDTEHWNLALAQLKAGH